jgi:uncharacterized protein (DUF1330 family)
LTTVGRVSAYAIAALKFTDRDVYNRYQAAFMELLMSFPDETAFRDRAESPDYQRISEDRRAGAETLVLRVQGLPQNAT